MSNQTYKILKEGTAKFYIKSAYIKNKDGATLLTKHGDPYVSILFKVTDSEGQTETIKKIFVLKYKRDIEKLFKSIGKEQWIGKIMSPKFPWEALEDDEGYCRITTEHATEGYPEKTIIESFVKRPEADRYLDEQIASLEEESIEEKKTSSYSFSSAPAADSIADDSDLPF